MTDPIVAVLTAYWEARAGAWYYIIVRESHMQRISRMLNITRGATFDGLGPKDGVTPIFAIELEAYEVYIETADGEEEIHSGEYPPVQIPSELNQDPTDIDNYQITATEGFSAIVTGEGVEIGLDECVMGEPILYRFRLEARKRVPVPASERLPIMEPSQIFGEMNGLNTGLAPDLASFLTYMEFPQAEAFRLQ